MSRLKLEYSSVLVTASRESSREPTPRVSVVIPVKNGEHVIGKCLTAVCSQSFKPCEVIVVDGSSTDRTVDEAKRFSVHVIQETYGTVGGARQTGVEHARGEYVAFTDADCAPEKDWLINIIKQFDTDVVGVGGGIMNTGTGLWEESIGLAMNTIVGSANSVQGRLFKEKRFVKSISGCNSCYRRETLMKIGGYNLTLSINEETELNTRLGKLGKLVYTPNAVVLHDQRRGLRAFAKRMYEFGTGRGKLRLWDLQCFPPLVMLLSLLSIIFSWWIFAGMLTLYASVIFSLGVKLAVQERKIRYLGSIPTVYAIEHISYSAGFLKGLFRI